jgi:NMD protein affecting ribosome stability and mRNA decay
MSGSITLHPEKGVNPRLCFCPRCGEEANELVLLGAKDKVDTCTGCGLVHYGGVAFGGACGRCRGRSFKSRKLEDTERVPASKLCDKCDAEMLGFKAEVERGGVYFRCTACHAEGVVKAESALAVNVRREAGVEAPAPVGVEFDATTCPQCAAKGEAS